MSFRALGSCPALVTALMAALAAASCSGEPPPLPGYPPPGDASGGKVDAPAATTPGPGTAPVAKPPATATPAGPPAMPPARQAFFSGPLPDGGADGVIDRQLLALVEAALPGAEVRVALFTWRSLTMADAFVAASERGVDVRIVLDNENLSATGGDSAAVARLRAGLPAGHLIICHPGEANGGCLGNRVNHNKFFLFSALADGSMDVVAQTSENLNDGRMHNNLVVLRGDRALHAGYQQFWEDMAREVRNLSYGWVAEGEPGVRVHFFPLAEGDPVLELLQRVQCEPGARLRVAMAYFTDRRLGIARQLAALAAAGCQVEVVIDQVGMTTPGEGVKATLEASAADLVVFYDGDRPGVHSKYLLIDAPLQSEAGTVWSRRVLTGSHNYTGEALRNNDETLLELEDADLHAAFVADFERVRAAALANQPASPP